MLGLAQCTSTLMFIVNVCVCVCMLVRVRACLSNVDVFVDVCVCVYFTAFGSRVFYAGTPQTLTGLFNRGTHPWTAVVYPASTPVWAVVPEKGKLLFPHG